MIDKPPPVTLGELKKGKAPAAGDAKTVTPIPPPSRKGQGTTGYKSAR